MNPEGPTECACSDGNRCRDTINTTSRTPRWTSVYVSIDPVLNVALKLLRMVHMVTDLLGFN